MKRLYLLVKYTLLACFDTTHSYELTKAGGWGEYYAKHGIGNSIDDTVNTLQGEPLVKLDKHLRHI